jgi:hypothetical protein
MLSPVRRARRSPRFAVAGIARSVSQGRGAALRFGRSRLGSLGPSRLRSTGDTDMPSTINLRLIGIWFCVGFFTGAGWAIAAVIVSRVLGRL